MSELSVSEPPSLELRLRRALDDNRFPCDCLTGSRLYWEHSHNCVWRMLSEAAEECEESDAATALCSRQAELLTEVVDALRGKPPADVAWSHHDAGELARLFRDVYDKRWSGEEQAAIAAVTEAIKK